MGKKCIGDVDGAGPACKCGQSGAASVPPEINNMPKLITADPNEAEKLELSRGQYRISGTLKNVDQDLEAVFLRDVQRGVWIGDEFKRLHFYKIDIQPPVSDPESGEISARYVMQFRVLDNVFPLVPIVWAGSAVATATAGYFFIDKVESFTETAGGQLVTIALAVGSLAGAFLLFR